MHRKASGGGTYRGRHGKGDYGGEKVLPCPVVIPVQLSLAAISASNQRVAITASASSAVRHPCSPDRGLRMGSRKAAAQGCKPMISRIPPVRTALPRAGRECGMLAWK